MSPEARVTVHSCVALMRTLRGVTEEDVQAVATYLGIVVDQAERGEACPQEDSRLPPFSPPYWSC